MDPMHRLLAAGLLAALALAPSLALGAGAGSEDRKALFGVCPGGQACPGDRGEDHTCPGDVPCTLDAQITVPVTIRFAVADLPGSDASPPDECSSSSSTVLTVTVAGTKPGGQPFRVVGTYTKGSLPDPCSMECRDHGSGRFNILLCISSQKRLTEETAFLAFGQNLEDWLRFSPLPADIEAGLLAELGGDGLRAMVTEATLIPGSFIDNIGEDAPSSAAYTATIQLVRTPRASTGTCTPNATTLCLQNGRFKVQLFWAVDPTDVPLTGAGPVVGEHTNEFGTFGFGNNTIREVLVKIVNACQGFEHYWLFASVLTTYPFEFTVTDLETGIVRNYLSPRIFGGHAPPLPSAFPLHSFADYGTFTCTDP